MSLEPSDPASVTPSTELDPPAYTHPTVPPPAVRRAGTELGWLGRWAGPSFLVGLLFLVAVDVVAGRSFLGGLLSAAGEAVGVSNAAAATESASADLGKVERLLRAFPEKVVSDTCPDLKEGPPLVLYSSIDALIGAKPRPVEARWFPWAAPVTSAFSTVSTRQVAVLRTRELAEPQPAKPGRYEGELVVFDTSTSVPLCAAIITASSSNAEAANEDFSVAIRRAVARGASHLKITLDI